MDDEYVVPIQKRALIIVSILCVGLVLFFVFTNYRLFGLDHMISAGLMAVLGLLVLYQLVQAFTTKKRLILRTNSIVLPEGREIPWENVEEVECYRVNYLVPYVVLNLRMGEKIRIKTVYLGYGWNLVLEYFEAYHGIDDDDE